MSRKGVFTVDDEKCNTKTLGDVLKGDRWKEDLQRTYICERCEKHFKGFDIELEPFGKNFGFMNPMMPLRLVDTSDNLIIGVGNTGYLDKNHEYCVMRCPICHEVHLFGMTPIDPNKVFGVD